MSIHYRVRCADLHGHLYAVTLTVDSPAEAQTLSLPVWIPGSYLVREFARHLRQPRARQQGKAVELVQQDKCTWVARCKPGRALEVRYEVYAFDNSVRAAWLDAERGFFNATSLLLRVHGHEDGEHLLQVEAPRGSGWSLATGLTPARTGRGGFGLYRASGYDELADCPVEMGRFWIGSFEARGVAHRFVVAGAPPSFDGERLLADTRAICESAIRLWHGEPQRGQGRGRGRGAATHRAPMGSYLFMLNTVDDGYGGLEHRNSTALICKRADLPRLGEAKPAEGYTTLLGLISHEYFHAWNVKRMRPAEFTRYDYTRENYTRMLWFFEGFTSYYDDLLLRRAGRIDDATYLRALQKTANQVEQTPGRLVQTVAEASFDAWIKYYRPDEGMPNATVSYYAKGALVALCFDLSLRAQGSSLDAVLRALWLASGGGPITEQDFARELAAHGGRSFEPELRDWVHSTQDLPVASLLQAQGVAVVREPAPLAQRLGLRVTEEQGSIRVKNVLWNGAAHRAGFSAGDEWLGVELGRQAWRLGRLDDLPALAGPLRQARAIVSRDRRILRLPLRLDAKADVLRLAVRDPARVKAWLDG